jgi:hypothetical protein
MKERENNKGLLARKILIEALPKLAYKINISEESQKRIDEIKENLGQNKDLNFIVYFNHICYEDPWFVGHVVNMFDPKKTRHLVAPISYYHIKSKNVGDSTLKSMEKLAGLCDVETIPIIQAYQIKKPEKYHYTQEQANVTYAKLTNRLKELKRNNIPTGFLISPEGTRSSDGVLGEAERGLPVFGRILGPVLFIPIGISYNQEFKRSKPNVFRSLNLEVGESHLYKTGKDRQDVDFYMDMLAKTLPEEMRGKWAQMPEVRN